MSGKKQFSPYVISKNSSVDKLRIQKEEKMGDPNRYPLDRHEEHIVVNFGSRSENCYEKVAIVTKAGGIVLNHPDMIKNASDKVVCKQLMRKAGIPTPNWQETSSLSYSEERSKGKLVSKSIKGLTLNFPIVAKLKIGSGGEGMVVFNKERELAAWLSSEKGLGSYFLEEVFQPNLKKNYEYRVSVSPLLDAKRMKYSESNFTSHLGEIIVLRKLMTKDAVEDGNFGRNLHLGNSYFSRDIKRSFNRNKTLVTIETAVAIATEACRACSLDFGAVDMIYDSESAKWTVLEINTAPSMGDDHHTFTVNRWKEALKAMIQEKKDLK